MRSIILLCALSMVSLGLVCALPSQEAMQGQFLDFIQKYNRSYGLDEITARFEYFTKSLAEVERLNLLNPHAQFGLNAYADRSPAELQHLRGYVKPDVNRSAAPELEAPSLRAPASMDWRTKGKVSAVKDQGQCGSCWAFSATEAIESAWAMKGHSVPTLAPQQITSCDFFDGGCGGGNTETAYSYVQLAGGIAPESKYPYLSGGGSSGMCYYSGSMAFPGIKVTGHSSAGKGDENKMKAIMSTSGPISVCVDASSWQYYKGGVMSSCGQSVDHCVQAVGYNSAANPPYWIVRNSWGSLWGEQGYIRLRMGGDTCAIASDPTIPTLA